MRFKLVELCENDSFREKYYFWIECFYQFFRKMLRVGKNSSLFLRLCTEVDINCHLLERLPRIFFETSFILQKHFAKYDRFYKLVEH